MQSKGRVNDRRGREEVETEVDARPSYICYKENHKKRRRPLARTYYVVDANPVKKGLEDWRADSRPPGASNARHRGRLAGEEPSGNPTY